MDMDTCVKHKYDKYVGLRLQCFAGLGPSVRQ